MPSLNRRDHRWPGRGCCRRGSSTDALGLQPLADLAEEPGELAEHQRPVPAADHLAQLAEQRVDLGRRQVGVRLVDQPGVQAELAQQGQRAEDREAVGVHVVDQAEDLLPLPLQPGLVDLAVLRVQVDLQDLLLLGGQVGGHLFLGAAQDQRLDPPLELGQPLGVALLLDRAGVVVAERGPGWGTGRAP